MKAAVILTFVTYLAATAPGAAQAPSAAPPRDTLIAVGDYRLHLRVYPAGPRVVVLESGHGLDANQWNDLAPQLVAATGATVVSYDRAGFGLSDLPSAPAEIRHEVEGLKSALHSLGLDRSVVLVGHSLGGFHIQLYAGLYPGTVKGLVYVDPQSVQFVESRGGAAAVVGGPGPFNDSTPNLTKVQRAVLRVVHGFVAAVDTMRHYPVPRGVPVIVIHAGKQWMATPEMNQQFRDAHQALVAAATDGKLVVAERSGHMVTKDEPGVVVAGVKEILEKTRER